MSVTLSASGLPHVARLRVENAAGKAVEVNLDPAGLLDLVEAAKDALADRTFSLPAGTRVVDRGRPGVTATLLDEDGDYFVEFEDEAAYYVPAPDLEVLP